MKLRHLIAPFLLLAPLAARAQTTTAAYQNFCQAGGKKVSLQGVLSQTMVQASYPKCQVAVYQTGTQTLATLTADMNSTPLANPFTANADGSFLFFAPTGQGYDVVISGGTPLAMPQPFTFTDVLLGGGGGGGGGGSFQGTPYHLAMFSQASLGKNIEDSFVTVTGVGSNAGLAIHSFRDGTLNGLASFNLTTQSFTPGYDHENTGYTEPALTFTQDDYFNGFKSFAHFGAIHRAIYGDNNGLDLGSSDRSGIFMPSDEGTNETIRFEHQELLPYQGLYNGTSGTDAAGHVIYAMVPQYNQADLGGDAPFIDLTTGVADTVDTVTSNDGPRTIHTTGAAHGVSVTGSLTTDAIPNLNASVNAPTVVSFNVAYSGANPTGSDAALYTYAGEPNIGGNNHEQILEKAHILSATAISGGYAVTAELNHSHYAGDHFSIGGTVGSYIEWTAHSVGSSSVYRTVEMVLENPTANSEVVGHPSEGIADSFAETGPIMRYQGVQVIDPNGSAVGGLATVARSNFSPALNDVLQQPNATAANYTLYRNNERILNHYAGWHGWNLNLQDSQIGAVDGHGNPNAVFGFDLPPNLATFMYEDQTGPFLILENQPNPSLVGGNCIGHSAIDCIQSITADTNTFFGQFDKGGTINLGIDYATKHWVLTGTDFSQPITTAQNAQVGSYPGVPSQGEYGLGLTNNGVPAINAVASFNDAGGLTSRFGFAYGNSLTSFGGGGFVSQWPVAAALNAQLQNVSFWQMMGSNMVFIGDAAGTVLPMVLDPTGNGTFHSQVTAASLSTGQATSVGNACTVGGYLTVTFDGMSRKVAFCN